MDSIGKHPVVIFSKSYCPFCMQAKALLAKFGPVHAIELDEVANGDKIHNELKQKTGLMTVPNIFIGGDQVGGNSDLQKLHAKGKLQPLIEKALRKEDQ